MEIYLKRLFVLDKYISKLNALMENESADINKQEDYYLINKDIINRYLSSDIYQQIHKYNDIYKELDCDNLIKKFIEENKLNKNIYDKKEQREKKIFNIFLEPEKLKIKYVEIPNNFFIINKDVCDFFGNISSKKVIIGNEGIFITNQIIPKGENSESKLLVYFIKSMNIQFDLNNFKVNKVYIFDQEQNFYNELEQKIKGKSTEQYFASRNFLNKGGISNMIDDGKKIFMYINMNRIENYVDKENEPDENRKYIENFYEIMKKSKKIV